MTNETDTSTTTSATTTTINSVIATSSITTTTAGTVATTRTTAPSIVTTIGTAVSTSVPLTLSTNTITSTATTAIMTTNVGAVPTTSTSIGPNTGPGTSTGTIATSSLSAHITAGKAVLKLMRKDLNQISQVGQQVVELGDRSLLGYFRAMKDRSDTIINEYLDRFDNITTSAILGGEPNLFPSVYDSEDRNNTQTMYYHIVQYFQKLEDEKCSTVSNPSPLDSRQNETIVYKARLPKIQIPTFKGVITEWPKFKQIFTSLIHSETSIPTIEKFHYLATSLSGDASTVISALTLTEENYSKAWDALVKKYDNKRLLASTYIDKILEFQPTKSPPTVQSLQCFIRTVGENISAFKSLNVNDEADFLFLSLAIKRLDPDTRERFEASCVGTEMPSYLKLIDFVQDRSRVLELSNPGLLIKGASSQAIRLKSKDQSKSQILSAVEGAKSVTDIDSVIPKTNYKCCCGSGHLLYQCTKFKDMSVPNRIAYLKKNRLCFNCFSRRHTATNCPSSKHCRSCPGKHNTLVHLNNVQRNYQPKNETRGNTSANLQNALSPSHNVPADNPPSVNNNITGSSQILLGTAEVLVPDVHGNLQPVRLVYDSGSQVSLITSDCCKRLGLTWSPVCKPLVGVGQTALPKTKGKVRCRLISRINPQNEIDAEAFVLDKDTITPILPSTSVDPSCISRISNLELADPNFYRSGKIDFLLGTKLFIQTLNSKETPKINDAIGGLSTIFGLVIFGEIPDGESINEDHCLSVLANPISNDLVSKFWEVEQISCPKLKGAEEEICEKQFLSTHYRTPEGRYVVSIPFKDDEVILGDSITSVKSRFFRLEAKLEKQPTLKAKYTEFLQEYLSLEHMSLADQPTKYLIPHHAVVKASDPESKIRVVFDASMATSEGSLNDKMWIGPNLQQDLSDISLNFRRYRVALVGDIVKMYRQVLITKEHRCFQHIIWRKERTDPLEIYELNTLTYGTASAPYLAMRCLQQLVEDEGSQYQEASKVLLQETYMDDMVTGCKTLQEAKTLKYQIEKLLSKGCFPVHKWVSNAPELNSEDTTVVNSHLSLTPIESRSTKILGMCWDPNQDVFFYQINPVQPHITKRSILSTIARLFDSQGLLSPVIFKAKCIMQSLWLLHIDWDETPPESIRLEWQTFSSQLPELKNLQIPRVVITPIIKNIQIIGFSDASEKGYSAALYLRVVDDSNSVLVSLIRAKSKLAPIKTMTIPRLELSGALLLARLLESVASFKSNLSINDVFLFSDSTIVLSWLRLSPHTMKTFVANRISAILEICTPDQWNHVSSYDNPADLSCRGVNPSEIAHKKLWWHGPPWLTSEPVKWPILKFQRCDRELPELKPTHEQVLFCFSKSEFTVSLIERYSSYRLLTRVVAYIYRILSNARLHCKSLRPESRELSVAEITHANIICIRAIQQMEFQKDYCFATKKNLTTRFISLNIFQDETGLLRVGGRLSNFELAYDHRHPILLPSRSHFTKILLDHLHLCNFHLGQRSLQGLVQRKYWIFSVRTEVRSAIFRCLICRKMKAKPLPPQMGNLPTSRARQGRPFICVGVDYAGPFQMKTSHRRNAPIEKVYLCLFVCMASTAVHLEIASSLSTEAFIAAFQRFVSRRGLPSNVYSDCGSNFIGASRQLKDLYIFLNQRNTQDIITRNATDLSVNWSFNPPHSPHFGGLWEASVKVAKYHFNRSIGSRPLTFEELSTVFIRIEGIMNSRPLGPLSSDPTKFDVLTPGHMLIGNAINALPEKDITCLNYSHLRRWQLIQYSTQHFWRRWSTEYYQLLQQRVKWRKGSESFKEGTLVLEVTNAPPLQWKTARISQVHPDRSGTVRVVTLVDSKGHLYKRSTHHLVPLLPDLVSYPSIQ